MRYGFVIPSGSAREQLEYAILADEAGWDGVFVWEGSYGVDAWSLLSAMAVETARVRLGTMLTPLPWRRPWKVASQAATLDELSGGRAIVAVGLGAVDPALGSTGEETDRRKRAQRLDEGIDLMRALWSGSRAFAGEVYRIDLARDVFDTVRLAQPDGVPIWCVGAWRHERSMRRILRCDGLLPYSPGRELTPEILGEMIQWLDDNGGRAAGFDVVQEGETPHDDPAKAAEIVQPWIDAGATWWLEAQWQLPEGADRKDLLTRRIAAGPPRPVS